MAYDSGKGEVFVANFGSDTVSVISDATDSVVATVAVGSGPEGVAYDSAKGEVFVANFDSRNVSVISDLTDRVVATVDVGYQPIGVAYDSGTGQIFVAAYDNVVDVISASTYALGPTIVVGSLPYGVAYVPQTNTIWVTNIGTNNVSVISDATDSVIKTVPTGTFPEGLAYDSGRGEVFVAQEGANAVEGFLYGSYTVNEIIQVGRGPDAVAYDGQNGMVFVANGDSDNVTVISDAAGDLVVASVPVGGYPTSVAYDTGKGEAFVTNSNSSSVSIVAWAYPTAFIETGLPTGTSWSVTLNGVEQSSTSNEISFWEPNGTYSYMIGVVPGYAPSPSSGSVTVNGASEEVAVPFTQVTYSATFTESGLPPGTMWYVNITGQPSLEGAATTLPMRLPNGSYTYTVATSDKLYAATGGSFTVAGAAVSESVTFLLQVFTVTYTESGIPAKTLATYGWAVELNGTLNSSLTTTISFSGMWKGTYTLLILGPSGYVTSEPGKQVVSAATSVGVAFTKGKTYTLTFSENGLPKGQSWCVAVDDAPQCSVTASLKYANLSTGTYGYAVVPPLTVRNITAKVGTTAVGLSGTLDLTKSRTVALTFAYIYAGEGSSPHAQTYGFFGWSVAISGSTVVVGAPYETVSGQNDAGHAYVFNARTGVLIATLTSPNAQSDGGFGWSVAISGSMVVVGAVGENVSGQSGAGHAYTFNAKTGTLIATLTSPNAQAYGYFGNSVAVAGATVVVGAPGETASGNSTAGHAYVFNAKTGAPIRTLTSPNAQTGGYLGYSVAISGSVVVVGAPYETAAGDSDAGHAYTFNAKTGALIATFTSPNAQAYGVFGSAVAVSGTTIVVGAPYETAAGDSEAGHAYTFNTKTGALISTLTSPNAQTGGYFGYSVEISGSVVVVGAYYETVSGDSGAGHAYTFNTKTGALISTLTSLNPQYDGLFGNSVAISGSTVVVGAPFESAFGLTEGGHVYLL